MDLEQTQQMAQRIGQRRDLLAAILRTTLQQEAAIQAGLVERLLDTLRDKDLLVDQLKKLQRELAPWATVPADQRQWDDRSSREACRRQIEESAKLQAAILEIDARCEQAMLDRRDELFDSLRNTTGAAAASRAYASLAGRGAASGGAGHAGGGATSSGAGLDLTSG